MGPLHQVETFSASQSPWFGLGCGERTIVQILYNNKNISDAKKYTEELDLQLWLNFPNPVAVANGKEVEAKKVKQGIYKAHQQEIQSTVSEERWQGKLIKNRVFSHDITVAILVSQNNETAAMMVSQTSPVGVELFSYANAFFCSNNLHRCWPRE